MDEADDGKMKELLKSYGATETDNRDENNAIATGLYVNIAYCFYRCIPLLRKIKSLYL